MNKDLNPESIEEEEKRAKEVEKAEREIKIREEAKWENKRWNTTWSDGLRHDKDGTRWNEDHDTEVNGANNYAQAGLNTGKTIP